MSMKYGQEEAAKHPVPDSKYVKVQCGAQERAPNYPVALIWGAVLLVIGAVAFAVGMG